MQPVCPSLPSSFLGFFFAVLATFFCLNPNLPAQSCQTSGDLDDATRSALTTAGQRYFAMAARGDSSSMRQNAVPSLASDFSGIEAAVKDHQKDLADAKPNLKGVFELTVEGTVPLSHGEFYCGVFGKNGQTANSAVFYLDGLQPGKYGVVLFDAASLTAQENVSFILEQAGTDWKIGGLYITPATVAGHNSEWYLAQAREYQKSGQIHNAWFYFLEARELASPLNFMATAATDNLYDQAHSVNVTDVPVGGKPADLSAGGTTYKLTSLFPEAVGNDLDLVAKYEVPDAANTNQAYQSNMAVINALVAKFPEIRSAFASVVARAVDANGHDYGTLMPMKDIKSGTTTTAADHAK
ncbi:MAG TPA: hypothetical protein VMX38_16535 [Verrucomicrobiae bacterium]|nr:hypothetical protein [Verrucomicrobiae bacterium]